MKKLLNFTPIIFALIFLGLAAWHQSMTGTDYTTSYLVRILLFGMLLLFMAVIFLAVATLVCLMRGEKTNAKYAAINCVGVAIITWLGVYIDAATLIHMT